MNTHREKVELPLSELRPMTPADVKVGQIVYRSAGGDGNEWYWHEIEDLSVPVLFRAFVRKDHAAKETK